MLAFGLRAKVATTVAAVSAATVCSAAYGATPVKPLHLGSKFQIDGRTGGLPGHQDRALGQVVLRGHWVDGGWMVLETTVTDDLGRYHLEITPHHKGTLTLEVATPDGHPYAFVLRVR
jgi:hypothetical protein